MWRKQLHRWKGNHKPKQQRQQRERQDLFKDLLYFNILVNCPLTIDIHSLHHQYCMCNIFLLSVSIISSRAVEEMTPNQARMRNCPWCGDDAYALGLGVLVPQGTVGAKAACLMVDTKMSNNLFARGCLGPGMIVRGIL